MRGSERGRRRGKERKGEERRRGKERRAPLPLSSLSHPTSERRERDRRCTCGSHLQPPRRPVRGVSSHIPVLRAAGFLACGMRERREKEGEGLGGRGEEEGRKSGGRGERGEEI